MHFKEYCKNGHLLIETRRQDNRGYFYCIKCQRESGLRYCQSEKGRLTKKEYRKSKKGKELKRILNRNLYHKLRQEWLEFFEKTHRNYCRRCEYNRCFSALDFHHKDPKEKEKEISGIIHRKFTEDRIKEIEKTITLCRVCHAELHEGLWKLEELDNGERYSGWAWRP